jgi:tetrahydromethanopterin S-methyltransferase subunit B
VTVIHLTDHLPTQEIPIWSGRPTPHAKPSRLHCIATSQLAADIKSRGFLIGLILAAVVALILSLVTQ